MRFTKMQGAGNDFIIINNIEERIAPEKFPAIAKRLCSRRLSIGADGIMFVERPSEGGDFRMEFYNSDGSLGEMCGNGARCISRYGHEKGLAHGDTVAVETTAGLVTGRRRDVRTYTVKLNDPTVIKLDEEIELYGQRFECTYIELGDPGLPHAVFVVDGWQEIPEEDLRELCRALRHHEKFPKGANVTFCEVSDIDHVTARTFERGVEDFTLACGTGCGATVTALTMMGLVSGYNVHISMPGGELYVTVTVDGKGARDIYLTGPTNVIAEGTIMDEELELS